MRLLETNLECPWENVALDEALLDEAEEAGRPIETLRVWEAVTPMVVIGRASRVDQEVEREYCERHRIPIIRRCSGGAAVVAGPGCLMYAVVLSYDLRPELRPVDHAHRFVLQQMRTALRHAVDDVDVRGTSDLAVGDRKISGNSMRCRRTHFLYHGTLLYDFPVEQIARCLRNPPRQPEYRRRREHLGFVINVAVDRAVLARRIIQQWDPHEVAGELPRARLRQLVAEKYRMPHWNLRHL